MKNTLLNHQIHRALRALMGLSLMVGMSNTTFAQFSIWNNPGSTGSYSDVAGWNGGSVVNAVPNGIEAYIFNGGVTVSTGGNFTPSQLIMGWEDGNNGSLSQSGGNVTTASWTRVGYAGTQTYNQSGGTFSASDLMVGWVNPGRSPGTGVVNQTGGNFETRNIAYVGLQGGTGTLNVEGGVNTSTRMIVGWQGGGNGTINLTGGNMSVYETSFVGFDGGTGTLNISGGTYTATGTPSAYGADNFGSFRIADFGVNSGTVNLSGTGVVNAARYTAVGGWGNGTLNITGGTWNQAAGGIVVGDHPAGVGFTGRGDVNQSGGTVNADAILLQQGTYNLNGGTLVTDAVADTSAGATGVFNINGGTLRARVNHADFITADTVEIKSGGATIDTTDKEVWVTKGMVGAGSLTKTGSGILKLDGANTFAGNTAVNQGTLTVNGSLAGGVSVASGSLLKGSGTIGGASTVNGTLAAGNSPGQMTFSSDLSLGSGSNIVWELFGNTSSDATQFDRISVGGNLLATSGAGITLDFGNLAGGSTVDWSDSFWSSAQSWTFLMVAGSTTGFDNLSLLNSTFLDAAGNSLATARSGSSFSLSQSGNSIMVSYAAVPEPGTGSLLLMGLASLTLLRMRRSARI